MKSKLLSIYIFLSVHILKYVYGFRKISTKLIYAQFYHETANFQSQVFTQNKNVSGMREAKIRKNTALGSRLNHAYYKSVFHSIVDYFLRQKYFNINSSNDEQYISSTVNSNYAEDTQYQTKWLNIYRSITYPKLYVLALIPFIVYFLFFSKLNIITYVRKLI